MKPIGNCAGAPNPTRVPAPAEWVPCMVEVLAYQPNVEHSPVNQVAVCARTWHVHQAASLLANDLSKDCCQGSSQKTWTSQYRSSGSLQVQNNTHRLTHNQSRPIPSKTDLNARTNSRHISTGLVSFATTRLGAYPRFRAWRRSGPTPERRSGRSREAAAVASPRRAQIAGRRTVCS